MLMPTVVVKLLFEHMPAAIAVGLLFSFYGEGYSLLLVALCFGWLLDVDHYFDHLLWCRKQRRNLILKDFFLGTHFKESNKVFVPLHSWELPTATLLFAQSSPYMKMEIICASIAWLCHIGQDQMSNRPSHLGYFLFYRVYTRFDMARFCGKH